MTGLPRSQPMSKHARAQYIWAMLKSYMLDECSLECASVSNADEKNLINLILNSVPDDAALTARVEELEKALREADPVTPITNPLVLPAGIKAGDYASRSPFVQGVREAVIAKCEAIALAIDSGRGNEKEIAKAIRALKPQDGGETGR